MTAAISVKRIYSAPHGLELLHATLHKCLTPCSRIHNTFYKENYCRFAPAVLLGVLNTWIIIEFKRISRRRLLLSRGMSCEVSAIPSQSYFEGNVNSTVVNPSPTNGQVEKNTEPAAPALVAPSSDSPLDDNPNAVTNVVSSNHTVPYSDSYTLEKEATIVDPQGLNNNNGHVVSGKCTPEGATTPIVNGYRPVLTGEDVGSSKNSSINRGQEETIVLSAINVSGE